MSFWESQPQSLKQQLSAALSGFDKDILEQFYALTPDQLTHLIEIYSDSYGIGPAAYARRTYRGWKHGAVRPSAQTINRLLDSLPLVLNLTASVSCCEGQAAEEAMRLVAEQKRGEIKYANASRDIANFVDNADLMEQRKKDYQMSAEFEGASGVTKIQVGRNWSRTLIAGSAIGILLLLIVLYVLMK